MYSTNGRTNALYAFCFTVVEHMFRLRFRNPIVVFALGTDHLTSRGRGEGVMGFF